MAPRSLWESGDRGRLSLHRHYLEPNENLHFRQNRAEMGQPIENQGVDGRIVRSAATTQTGRDPSTAFSSALRTETSLRMTGSRGGRGCPLYTCKIKRPCPFDCAQGRLSRAAAPTPLSRKTVMLSGAVRARSGLTAESKHPYLYSTASAGTIPKPGPSNADSGAPAEQSSLRGPHPFS